MEKIYNVAEATKELNIKGVGRNKLYFIMREMGLINDINWPAEQYINEGLLKGALAYFAKGITIGNKPKTLIIGENGLEFVKSIVMRYLQNPEEATKNVIKPDIPTIHNDFGKAL